MDGKMKTFLQKLKKKLHSQHAPAH
uniref:Uncharacterized protein n=1 Tax=Anguilla anguilla TaxID=7936 RepID=A0A0E9Q7V7_ANGAN